MFYSGHKGYHGIKSNSKCLLLQMDSLVVYMVRLERLLYSLFTSEPELDTACLYDDLAYTLKYDIFGPFALRTCIALLF